MDNLGETTTHYSLLELAQQLNTAIKLAGFQRGAVWKEAQIELLWDSILSGFPIGALLFAPAHDKDLEQVGGRKMQGGRDGLNSFLEPIGSEVEFIVVDGQQRLDAISLGMLDGIENARLWLDLATPGEDAPRFEFYVCTKENPWGVNASTAQKREALAKLGYDENELRSPDVSQTTPLRAHFPVPFRELCKALRKYGLDIQKVMADLASWTKEKSHEPRQDLLSILQCVQTAVIDGQYFIPIITVKGLDKSQIGKIFKRLNNGGTPPSEAELFFSALKLHWPDAHNLVGQIYNDNQTGKFLNPIQIVSLSVRIANPGELELSLKKFDRFMAEYGQELENLLSLSDDKEPRSRLHQYLLWAKQALMFSSEPNDPGIPAPILLQIRPRVWQTLVYWIAHHPSPISNPDRMEMLRYALFDHFYVDTRLSSDKLSRVPFGESEVNGIKSFSLAEEDHFPGKEIYKALIPVLSEQKFWMELLTPKQYSDKVWSESPNYSVLYHEEGLIFWGQRESFHTWFGQFEKDVYWIRKEKPYDFDHILPVSYLKFYGPSGTSAYCHPKMESRYIRNPVMHNAGNLRCWPSGANRGNQNKNLDQKFLLGRKDMAVTDRELRRYGMDFVGDVRRASLISDDSVKDWKIAANLDGETNNWKKLDRFQAFRQAVESRRISMYSALYHALEWKTWK